MKYRPEIDGLRAVAVLPVMAFHAGLAFAPGGYVGVDVFFVISGYLITTSLVSEIAEGRFSLAHFYERRVRRILPALFFVIAVCIPFAWMWMLPGEFENFAQSVTATVLFSNNVLLWLTSGYFERAAETKPLLHTWSLGVEEQFYILFPLILMALGRTRRILWGVIVLALASAALMQWSVVTGSPGAEARFFLLPTRAWELLVGSLVALALRHWMVPANGLLAAAGVVLILASVGLLDEATDFPSWVALMPVGGTALVILFARPAEPVGRLLSMRVPVGIGMISYSAYLWHQPVFVFYEMRTLSEIGPAVAVALILLCLGLAALSWRFVEQPFRRGRAPILPRRVRLFVVAAIAGAALSGFGVLGHVRDGIPERMSETARALAASTLDPHERNCQFGPREAVPAHPIDACSGFMPSGRPDVVLLGDSHGGAIAQTVQEALRDAGLQSYAATYLGCLGLPGFYRVDLGTRHGCDAYSRGIRSYLDVSGAQVAVLTARFTLGWAGFRFDNGEGGAADGAPNHVDLLSHADARARPDSAARRARYLAALEREILALADAMPLVLVYPIPEAGWRVPERMARLAMFGTPPDEIEVTTARSAYDRRNAAILDLFDRLDHPDIHKVRAHKALCTDGPAGRCANSSDGVPLYSDNNHLSAAGAARIAPSIVEQVSRALAGARAER